MSTETHLKQHYIGGRWVDSKGGKLHEVINPATEEAASTVVLGSAADVDDAVAAAKEAFKSFSQTTREERLELLNRIVEEYKKRAPDLAKSMASEMGAPVSFAGTAQVEIEARHAAVALDHLPCLVADGHEPDPRRAHQRLLRPGHHHVP